MKLTFTHQGATRTLSKHPAVIRKLKAGEMTEAEARLQRWCLRYTINSRQTQFWLPANDRDAIRAAKDILTGQQSQPSDFAAFIAHKEARRSITIGQLAEEWIAGGLPFNNIKSRSPEAAARLKDTLGRALPWWTGHPVATITTKTHEDYASHRRPALRSADLEMACLSSLCDWAVLTGRTEANPFAKRTTFAEVKQHCHEACPDNDEVLHRMLAWMFEPITDAHHQASLRQTILAAGSLAFSALTGLRPGEPSLLLHLPPLAETPGKTADLKPGTIFRDRMGLLRMKVWRLKNGQNPFVLLHPAAENFLSAWRTWMARHKANEDKPILENWRLLCRASAPARAEVIHKEDKPLFPLGTNDLTTLNRALNRASAALGLPHFKPHGFGRAFYVKVRRSMGEDDSAISSELGQATDADLIRSIYGDPDDLVGGHLHDWLPENGRPAWDLIASPVLARKPKPSATAVHA